jgi:hypothetical protein
MLATTRPLWRFDSISLEESDMQRVLFLRNGLLSALVATATLALAGFAQVAQADHSSTKFEGKKANTGFVMHSTSGGKQVLTLSDDFKVPDAPAPHWQLVDSKGNVYLLNRLVIKGDKFNRSITVPAYVPDVVKVQIWCAWAESLLGEASFNTAVR